MQKPRSCAILQPQALFNYPAGETMLPVSKKPEELEPASAASLVLRAWIGGLCVRHGTTPLHCAHPAPKHGRKVRNRELPIPSFSSWSRRCSVIGTFWPKPASTPLDRAQAQFRCEHEAVTCPSAVQRGPLCFEEQRIYLFWTEKLLCYSA